MPTLRSAARPRPAAARGARRRATLAALLTASVASSAAHAQNVPGVASPAGAVSKSATATRATAANVVPLHGTVYDSLARAPLVGAMVQAVRVDNAASARSASTDSTGAFQLDSLTPGRYMLGFLHPTLDLLSVQVTPVLLVVDGRALPSVTLAVPGPNTVRATVCPPIAAGDSTGAVAGLVRDALTGNAAPGATVVLSWQELALTRQGLQREVRRVPTTVRTDGTFLVCGVPTDAPITASASAPGATSGLVELAAPPRGLVVQQLAVGPVAAAGGKAAPDDSASAAERGGLPRPAPGTARLVGRVVGPDAQPVRGARVRVWGTDARVESGPDGRYELRDLPSGTFTVEVRGVGLEPAKTPVDLANGQTAQLRVALTKAAAQLERVAVVGTATERSRFLEDFAVRRRTGQGRYFTAAELAERHAVTLTDVIRGTPSLRVIPRGARGNVLRGRAWCIPNVWLDGSLIRNGANEIDDLVTAQNVEAVEVYGGGAIIPAQFNSTGTGGSLSGGPTTCGAVVIWTMR